MAGGLIGVVQFLAVWTAGYPLGTSSSYVKVTGHLASFFDASIAKIAYFEKYMTSGKIEWQLALVLGIILGAFISSHLSKVRRGDSSPVWKTVSFQQGSTGRAVMAFLGGFLMLMGARIAGGCTSGHGVSGIALMGVGSIVTVAMLFVGGILASFIFDRK